MAEAYSTAGLIVLLVAICAGVICAGVFSFLCVAAGSRMSI
jgi:hypothetical protein